MGTTTLPQAQALRSSGCPVTGPEISLLSRSHEIAPARFSGFSIALDLVDRWCSITNDLSMPIDTLRSELRLTLDGKAPDERTERKQQRRADQALADAVNGCEVRIVRNPYRGRR